MVNKNTALTRGFMLTPWILDNSGNLIELEYDYVSVSVLKVI